MKFITTLIFFTILSNLLFASNLIDSLQQKINQANDIKEKIKLLNELSLEVSNVNPYEAEKHTSEALSLSYKNNYKDLLGDTYRSLSLIKFYQTRYSESLEFADSSLQYYQIYENKVGEAKALNLIGLNYSEYGDNEKTMLYYNKCLDIRRSINDYDGIASSLNNIGVQFKGQHDYNNALKFYKEALKISENHNINELSIALYYDNIGEIFLIQEKYDESFNAFTKALELRKKSSNPQWLANSYRSLGDFYLSIKKPNEANLNYLKSLQFAKKTKILYEIESSLNGLRKAHALLGDYKNAYKFFEQYKNVTDSINKSDLATKITQIELNAQFEKQRQIEQLIQEKKDIETKQIIEKQKIVRNSAILVIVLFFIIIIVVYYNYKRKKKDNKLLKTQKEEIEAKNVEILQRNEEITAQRDEIESQRDAIFTQKEHIELMHLELTSSIHYAKKIQSAIIPSNSYIESIITDFFLINMPAQIISGDFFWIHKKENFTFIAVADCTGHGVPGAFMSMLGISFLNEIITKNNIIHPNQILNQLRVEIINALHQKGEPGEQKDGMDLSLLVIDRITNKCEFSGANNPLYIVKSKKLKVKSSVIADDEQIKQFQNVILSNSEESKLDEPSSLQLYELKGDKMPISIYVRMDNFTNYEFNLNKGDCLYLFSDGYADQFGGSKGKKFKYHKFKELLISNNEKSMPEQEKILENTIKNWIGTRDQIDDITVFGMEI